MASISLGPPELPVPVIPTSLGRLGPCLEVHGVPLRDLWGLGFRVQGTCKRGYKSSNMGCKHSCPTYNHAYN